MQTLRHWHRQRILKRSQLPVRVWQALRADLPLLHGLDATSEQRLQELVILFLHEKSFIPQGGIEIDDTIRLTIAVQACVPILNLGLDYYHDWSSIIVYPAGFISRREYPDPVGVVHSYHGPLVGEAWDLGPLVLSWHDVLCSGRGFNVIIHECAHKLDMLNGVANGFPPLHDDMDPAWWSRVFNTVYEKFCRQIESGAEPPIDSYAAESPEEFFAVTSEAFFDIPATLQLHYPSIYRQLSAFYRQDPLARAAARPVSILTTPF
jgi:Mlc titration factor MtfA (ptsG expression regulator)